MECDTGNLAMVEPFCRMMGVTLENVEFLERLTKLLREYISKTEETDEIEDCCERVALDEYLTGGATMTEIFPGCGFFLDTKVWHVLCLEYKQEPSNWQTFVSSILHEVYDKELQHYSAKERRGKPGINSKLLKGLYWKINQEGPKPIKKMEFTAYINHSLSNKRCYMNKELFKVLC